MLEKSERGVCLKVKVRPSGRKNIIEGVHNSELKLCVTTAPEKGKANKAVIKLLASELKVSASNLEIVRGQTSQHKTILIGGLDENEIRRRLLTGERNERS